MNEGQGQGVYKGGTLEQWEYIALFEVYGHGDSKEDIGTLGKFRDNFSNHQIVHKQVRYPK